MYPCGKPSSASILIDRKAVRRAPPLTPPLPPPPTIHFSSSHRGPLSFLSHISSISDMSQPSSPSSFRDLFNASLQDYEIQTGTKLDDHPLAKKLETCDSVESITTIIQKQAQKFREYRGDDGKLMKSLKFSVDV